MKLLIMQFSPTSFQLYKNYFFSGMSSHIVQYVSAKLHGVTG
jgi:hypothetical protein